MSTAMKLDIAYAAIALLIVILYIVVKVTKKSETNTHTSKGQEVLETPMVFGGATMNFTSIIVPNEIKGVSVFLDRAPKASDDCFIAMEFGYKSKGNKQQTPLRKIYYIYDKKTKVREVDSSTFYAISLLLRENKIWEKFYSL